MKEWYQRSSICVVPSLWEEPFGLVAVEAMASGRPVCVSRVGGLQYIPVHGESGYVYDRLDGEALARHLNNLLDDDKPARHNGCGWAAARGKAIHLGYGHRHAVPSPPGIDLSLNTSERICVFYTPGQNLARLLGHIRNRYPHAHLEALVPPDFPNVEALTSLPTR